jgi:hypothetical protein
MARGVGVGVAIVLRTKMTMMMRWGKEIIVIVFVVWHATC